MSQDKIAERFALLTPAEWRTLAAQTVWYFRTNGIKPCPPKILAGFDGEAPTREAWEAVCKKVSAKRRAARYAARRQVLLQRREARRTYMRGYMKDYRQRQKGAPNASSGS